MWGNTVKMPNKRCSKDSAKSILLFAVCTDVGILREQDAVAVSRVCLE